MTIYVLSGFNNYYNRIVKKFDTIEEYMPYVLHTQNNYNFVPNDGVNTQVVLGSNVNTYDGTGDYLIVTELKQVPDDVYHDVFVWKEFIVSRWFIIESARDRAGQFTLTLHRDLIVDFYDSVINAPMFIEKATLASDSPLIYNSEQMTFNQIKTSETLIKDKSKCPWIVGYYAKNISQDNLKGIINRNILNDFYDYAIDQNIESWKFYQYTQQDFLTEPSTINWRFYGKDVFEGQPGWFKIEHPGKYITSYMTGNSSPVSYGNVAPGVNMNVGIALEIQVKANSSTLFSQLPAYVSYNSNTVLKEFLSYNDSIVKDASGRFFKITITPSENVNKVTDIISGNLFETLSTVLSGVASVNGTPNSSTFKVETIHSTYRMKIVELTNLESTWDMSGSKIITEDAPYNIFAIPYGSVELQLNGEPIVTSNANDSIATANAIIQQMDVNLYDIQLLPYCPLVLDEDAIINVKSNLNYSLITTPGSTETDTRVPIGFILNVSSSRFTKNIYLDNPIVIRNVKIENECDMYKLCSPNWASEYQFSAAKNGGIQYFNIDCEYKPFTPYIHINPNFGNLYGRDFNDARGLILNGDFSLAQINDKWQQYQTQNKNFQNIFDRQIQNMEVQHKVRRIQEIAGSVAGVGSGAAGGALAGSMIMPGIGTAVGAAIGGIASLGGGVADYAINEMLRNEAMDYTKDLFGYQLDNVKALPYTLTKVSAFNNNNKIFPVLEYYTCTYKEKEALANKIAYNGMSVGVIGTMSQFIENRWSYNGIESKGYIKGQLIRLETIEDDYHLINAIAGELNKGVYIQ